MTLEEGRHEDSELLVTSQTRFRVPREAVKNDNPHASISYCHIFANQVPNQLLSQRYTPVFCGGGGGRGNQTDHCISLCSLLLEPLHRKIRVPMPFSSL